MMRQAAALALATMPAKAMADFVETQGVLTDDAFYRLVSCGAAPDRECTQPVLHWHVDRPLRVAIKRMDRAFLGGKQKRAQASVTRAIQRINAAGAAISLEQVPMGDPADVDIYFLDTDGSDPIRGTGITGIDGAFVPGAKVLVWADGAPGEITKARILFGTRLSIRHYESAMLEELIQALGLMTDIRNPLYDGVSVFSQDSNAAKTLGPQDLMALRRHYPPNQE